MRKEYFYPVLHEIQEIFGLRGVLEMLELRQYALFLHHMHYPSYIPKVDQNVIDKLDRVIGHYRTDKQDFRRHIID